MAIPPIRRRVFRTQTAAPANAPATLTDGEGHDHESHRGRPASA